MAAVSPVPTIDAAILAAWELRANSVRHLGTGLINRTFLAQTRAGEWRVLQLVNPIFPPEVNKDIEAVTTHLARRGLQTPRLLRDREGRLCVPDAAGHWRLMTLVPGRVLDAVGNATQAREAGRLLASFHRALNDLDHEFHHRRAPVHEPARHLAALRRALERHAQHRLYAAAAPLAEAILAAAQALPATPATPPRIVHGDPKISNLVFDDADRALCMLDLDTVGRMALPFELGDAFRSWCNLSVESDPRGRFSAKYFDAAVRGYGAVAAGWIRADEADSLVQATAIIQVELAARFCADALEEQYFGWDPQAFASRGDHNLVRARGQLAVHRSLLAQRERLEDSAAKAFKRSSSA